MTPAARVFEFGPFRLDTRGKLLFRDGERVSLPPKAAEVLVALIEHRPDAVGREELLRGVWAETAVEDGSLTSHVSLLRRVLGERRGGPRYIETIPKRGYRFLAMVEEVDRSPRSAGASRAMLAVLPFENLSGEDQDFFSDGLTEETITHLSRLAPERLGVIARASVARYKRNPRSIREIGEELGVSHVLEGSVRRSGRRARVTAQLIDVSDQTHVWAESYERDLGDLLALQVDLARAIGGEIEIKLAPLAPRSRESLTVDPEAYETYLKGRYLWNRRSLEAVRKSIRYFETCIEREPRYAAARSGLADAYMTLHDDGRLSPKEATVKAKHSAEEALRIDPALAEAHTSLAHAFFHELDWLRAGEEFRRAIELNRNYAAARFYYANFLVAFGRFDEAIEEARAALVLDPVSLPAGSNVASVYYHARRYDEAIEHCRRVLEIDPAFARSLEDLGRNYEQQQKHEEAILAFEKAAEISGRDLRPLSSLAHGYAVAGRRREARRVLAEIERLAKEGYVSAFAFAIVHAGLGDRNQAFEYLAKACDERSSGLPFLNVEPRLDSLRREPRFQALVSRMGLVGKLPTSRRR